MSKQGKRKITVELPKSKDLSNRPSVFERLGTKKASGVVKKTVESCRQWAQNGTCVYGKGCKFASTHVLISPSKQRAAIKDNDSKKTKDDAKSRLHSAVVVRSGRSPDGEIDNWDQDDLECADTDVLEKRRQQLQRELELQLKMDSGKDMRKEKKKPVSSSSSSRSSSSSSASSSSSDGSSSSSSSGREARRKTKKGKLKRNSSSSSDEPSKKKFAKSDTKKSDAKKSNIKKDDRLTKKSDPKKKIIPKPALGKKSLSPGKKSGGTPPITSKSFAKSNVKHPIAKGSPVRKRSVSPHSSKDRDKDRDRPKEKDKDNKDKERERNRPRSRSPKKARSRSPRKDNRRKASSERSRPVSPKKQVRRDASADKHRKRSQSRERDRTRDKDRSIERRKEKHDDKDRHDRKDRGRDRNKETKRDEGKRRGRERGLGRGDKGLEKPSKPMERLLPRPEERMAALAAITNKNFDGDKNSPASKDRQDTHSERGGRKAEREHDRPGKRSGSMDREGDYDMAGERTYDRSRSLERYDREDERYEAGREGDRSPGYSGRDRHFDANYEGAGPSRRYPEDGERMYGDHIGYEDRRHRDRSWEGRSGSMDRERGYMHPSKEWSNEDYRPGGEWPRERHWPVHEPPMNEWADKEQEMEGWHHRGHPQGSHRGRGHDGYGRGMRIDRGRGDKRRGPQREPAATVAAAKGTPPPQPAEPQAKPEAEDDKPIPDDLSEISDDPDDILNRDDMVDHNMDEDSQSAVAAEDNTSKPDAVDNQSTQDTNGVTEEKDTNDTKDDDENLDFEEISDGELEEERTRAGLGDALGVDWASLVADVHRKEQATTATGGARDRWRPERVLARLGLSVHMAGTDAVAAVLAANNEILSSGGDSSQENGDVGVPSVDTLHPVAAIQVAQEKRKRQRAALFGSGCEITRALSARRDLALRRHLCRLPGAERALPPARTASHPDLHAAARALLQAPG